MRAAMARSWSHRPRPADTSNNKSTWALMGDDTDSPNLARILTSVQARWNIDPTKLLLTGQSHEQLLGQWRPVVGRVRIGADQRDPAE